MDIRLYYTQSGEGEPLFLLHGNGEDSMYFRQQIGALAGRYRVIAVDTRGHGHSPRGTAPFTLSQFADDLAELMDQLGICRAHLLGYSDGGNIAILFALRYPERVGRLILNGANLYPAGLKPLTLATVMIGYLFYGFLSCFSQGFADQRDLFSLMALQPHIRSDDLKRIQAPTLVLAGTRDVIRRKHTRLISGSIPYASLKILPGGHAIALQNAEAYNRTVLSFLSGNRSASNVYDI